MSNHTVRLTTEAHATATIRWWSPDTSPVSAFAAEELQAYVRDISGADLSVDSVSVDCPSETPASAVLVLSDDADPALADLVAVAADNLEGADTDAYTLQTADGAFVLAGTTHRGTLYAVYDFLRRQGVRFFAPDFAFYDGHAEQIPADPDVTANQLGVVEEPDLAYRRKYVEEGISHTEDNLVELIDWMAKTRHNVFVCPTDYRNFGVTQWSAWRETLVPELERRGLLLESGGHGFDSFLSPLTYSDDHPEWFVEEHNVFDLTNDAAVETYIENVVTYLDDHPEIDIFDVWPPDEPTWPPRVIDAFGSIENAYGFVVNRLTETLTEEFPDLTVEAIAYSNHIRPPDPEYMFDDTVVVDFAPINRSYEDHLFADVGTNPEYAGLVRAWTDAFDGPIALYEYYRKYSWHSLPVLLVDLIGEELPLYDDAGIDGLGIYSEPADWLTYELIHVLTAELAWTTGHDTDAYVESYLDDRYGPVADAVGTYLDCVETAGRTLYDSFGGDYDDPETVALVRNNYQDAREVLQDARTDADTDGLFLIQKLINNLEFAIADIEISYYGLRGDRTEEALARRRTEEAMFEQRFEGTILQTQRVLNRYTDLRIPPGQPWLWELYREES